MSNYMLLTEMSAYSNAVQQYGKDAGVVVGTLQSPCEHYSFLLFCYS